MIRIIMSVLATLAVVFAASCIDGFYIQQAMLFVSGAMFCALCMLSKTSEEV